MCMQQHRGAKSTDVWWRAGREEGKGMAQMEVRRYISIPERACASKLRSCSVILEQRLTLRT